jgi:hypothetical protein
MTIDNSLADENLKKPSTQVGLNNLRQRLLLSITIILVLMKSSLNSLMRQPNAYSRKQSYESA